MRAARASGYENCQDFRSGKVENSCFVINRRVRRTDLLTQTPLNRIQIRTYLFWCAIVHDADEQHSRVTNRGRVSEGHNGLEPVLRIRKDLPFNETMLRVV